MSVTTAAPYAPVLPELRLVPAPVSEPPYDDELPSPVPSGAPTLGPLRTLAPLLRLVPAIVDDEDALAPRTPACELPSPRPVARGLVQGLLEVLAGVRPLAQLQRGTSVELYAQLEQRLQHTPRVAGTRPVTGAVRSLHVQEREDGVAEVCATVHRGKRMAAVALRLEGVRGQWCCTELAGL